MDDTTIKFITNALRRSTIKWEGRNQCLNRGRRKKSVKVNNRWKQIWENDCEKCGEWFELRKDPFEVDHIVEVGPFLGDWNDWIKRLFCSQENLQRLCFACHQIKTNVFCATLRFSRKSTSKRVENPEELL